MPRERLGVRAAFLGRMCLFLSTFPAGGMALWCATFLEKASLHLKWDPGSLNPTPTEQQRSRSAVGISRRLFWSPEPGWGELSLVESTHPHPGALCSKQYLGRKGKCYLPSSLPSRECHDVQLPRGCIPNFCPCMSGLMVPQPRPWT